MSDHTLETRAEPPVLETGSQLSPKAQAAIQGPDLGPEPTAAARRLEAAAHQASARVPEHIPTPTGERVEYYKLRGRMGEELTVADLPHSVNLNDVTGKSNFANYDVVGPTELASVKVMERRPDGTPNVPAYDKYFRDIVNATSGANEQAAADLLALRDAAPDTWIALAPHLPAPVAAARSTGSLARAMAGYATLRVSGDQVDEVREALRSRAIEKPAAYGLELDRALTTEADRLVREHIKSFDGELNVSDLTWAATRQLDRRRGAALAGKPS